ncbi:MAG TPA: hypothetical protein PL131_01530 [Methylotenera sp.]|nr:hypothetical protein [Methylotenera sp.]HPH04526.1 hypothetical protein [Methylotenera sp.]HPN01191.1 hypothetical protein [Methylotenera sp.]
MKRLKIIEKQILFYFVILVVFLVGTLNSDFAFLPYSESAIDGFQSQMRHASEVLTGEASLDNDDGSGLEFVHIVRYIGVSPFLLLEVWLGTYASLTLLLCCILLVARPIYKEHPSVIRLLPFTLPLFLSGRSVLVALGVACIILSIYNYKHRYWMLWAGLIWVNLSSASVLSAIFLLIFLKPNHQQNNKVYNLQTKLALLLLILSLLASLINKYYGFQSGAAGYEAYETSTDNLLLTALSRSTLLVSLAEDQYLRGFAYLTVIVYLLYLMFFSIFFGRDKNNRTMLLCCISGIFFEGLGVVALFFPLFWVFLNVNLSNLTHVSPTKIFTDNVIDLNNNLSNIGPVK